MNAPSIRRPWTNDVPLGTEELGFLSAWREGGKKDVLAIANDQEDPGKGGYGPWQLSTGWGVRAFLRSEWGKRYASSFGNAQPGTKAFNDRYKAAVARDGVNFRKAQHDYLYNEFYVPVAEHAQENGFDLSNQGIREAIFSLAVQHKDAKAVIDRVIVAKEQQGDPTKVIAAIYGKRMEYVAGLETLSLKQKKDLIERYKKEGRQILLHDALVRSQDVLHKDLIDLSNPRNYPDGVVPE